MKVGWCVNVGIGVNDTDDMFFVGWVLSWVKTEKDSTCV